MGALLGRLVDAVITGDPARIAAFRVALDDKLSANTPIRLNPTNGHIIFESPQGTPTVHDLAIPRAEAPNNYVIVELMFVGDEGVSNATISYKEVASGVSEVHHIRPSASEGTVAEFGVAKGNGNTTVLRFVNTSDTKPFKEMFIKSVACGAVDVAYNEVSWLTTPSPVAVTLRPF